MATTTTTRPNLSLPLLLLWTLLLWALLAHGSPLATPSSFATAAAASSSPHHLLPQPAPRALSPPAAQATPTTGPRMPYPIPDTYNGTAFGRPPARGTGTGAARATGTGGWRGPPPAQVTAAPGRANGTTVAAAAQKDIPFIQTTYWSCVQWPTTVHCGWHEPILAVGDAAVAAAGGPTGGGTATVAARRACAVVGAGLLAGFVLGFV